MFELASSSDSGADLCVIIMKLVESVYQFMIRTWISTPEISLNTHTGLLVRKICLFKVWRNLRDVSVSVELKCIQSKTRKYE
jgi:hypothetical protein